MIYADELSSLGIVIKCEDLVNILSCSEYFCMRTIF